jgi:enoyl-CoA hydratase/carnithine racemase
MIESVLFEVSRGRATLTLNRTDVRNALTPDLLEGLADALRRAIADDSVRVIILTNSGHVFCAGADLSAGRAATPPPSAGLDDILTAMMDSPKPIVGRVAGHCMGGGVGLAAACDISIAHEAVRFGFTEVRIGVAPAVVSVVCLPKLRRSDALELFLTGERIDAARAADVGLITAVVAEDELDDAVESLVRKLAAGGPGALAAAKGLVFAVPGMERSAAFAWTTSLSGELFSSEEASEGMAAFRDKRSASWVPE